MGNHKRNFQKKKTLFFSSSRNHIKMANALKPYLDCIRTTMEAAMCLENFGSMVVERHNKPEVEARANKEIFLNPVTIRRNELQAVRIEGSINAIRVSVQVKQSEKLEVILVKKFMRSLCQRAEQFVIMRRKPVEGFDISFLVTNFHTEDMYKHKLIDFLITFMQDVDKEVNERKLAVSARARISAHEFLQQFV